MPNSISLLQPEDENPTSPHPQQPLPPIYVSIRELSTERKRFNVQPEFQRQTVWPIVMKQALIDTILRGDPVPPLEAYEEYDEKGEKTYIFDDGHQRIMAILDYVDGNFRTWTPSEKRQAEPGSEPPVEPRKPFDKLTLVARNYLLDYHIQINRIRRTSDEQIRTRFLRIQNQTPLSAAEKLNAYKSKATKAARAIEQHPFWADCYKMRAGKVNREQRFQSSLQLLAIELSSPGGFCNVHSAASLQSLAVGTNDKNITDSLIEAILIRLDVVTHVYHGTRFTERAISIAMYQSVMFLEQTGYRVQSSDKGKLTPWIDGLITASQRSAVPGYLRPIQGLTTKKGQQTFWSRYLKTVLNLFDVNKDAITNESARELVVESRLL
jgi:hypothetical protein